MKWDQDKLQNFLKYYDVDKISAIIIDEVSTMKPYMVAYLNTILQGAFQSKKPFGGKAIMFLRDFDQLPPMGGVVIA